MARKIRTVEISETPFDRQGLVSWWDQRRLNDGFVLVAGAGALGNEVIKNLALLGLGHLFIVDFDMVEISNLSRTVLFRMEHVEQSAPKALIAAQQAAALNPNPQAEVYAAHADLVWELGLSVFKQAQVVVCCVDNLEARHVINRYCRRLGIPWIDAAMLELSGTVTFYTPGANQPCYDCNFSPTTKAEQKEMTRRYSCADAIERHLAQQHEATIQTTSAILAGIQSQEAVRALHGLDIPGGRHVVYRGQYHNFIPADDGRQPSVLTVATLTVNPECPMHGEPIGGIVDLDEAGSGTTLGEFLSLVAQLGVVDPELKPGAVREEYVFISEVTCGKCGQSEMLNRPFFRNQPLDLICPICELNCVHCGHKYHRSDLTPDLLCPSCKSPQEVSYRRAKPGGSPPRKLTRFSARNAGHLMALTLDQLGIPAFDIVCVQGADHAQHYFSLKGDEPSVLEPVHF